jgi:hypothetical protein
MANMSVEQLAFVRGEDDGTLTWQVANELLQQKAGTPDQVRMYMDVPTAKLYERWTEDRLQERRKAHPYDFGLTATFQMKDGEPTTESVHETIEGLKRGIEADMKFPQFKLRPMTECVKEAGEELSANFKPLMDIPEEERYVKGIVAPKQDPPDHYYVGGVDFVAVEEDWREYDFGGGKIIRIENPQWLNVKRQTETLHSHRLIDENGVSHYIPSGWIGLRWKAPENMEFQV